MHELITLREFVQQFNANRIVYLARRLQEVLVLMRGQANALPVDQESRSELKKLFVQAQNLDDNMFKFTRLRNERFLTELDNPLYTNQEMQIDFTNVIDMFFDEMGALSYYQLADWATPYYEVPQRGWESALDEFPILFDVEEASKALALERYTASVFHSMRIVEHGLTAVANHFDVSTNKSNWHTIIVDIEKAIASRSSAEGAGWVDQQFYSEAAISFRFFKDAWRNHVMHNHEPFDEERAKRIYDHVKQFMNHIATTLTADR